MTKLIKAARNAVKVWSNHWDCSRSPGHHEMHAAMETLSNLVSDDDDYEKGYKAAKIQAAQLLEEEKEGHVNPDMIRAMEPE